MKIGLALSGGGAFAACHVGVLRALRQAGVPIDMISGASMGAVVAALFAAGYTPEEISVLLSRMDWREITGNYLLNLLYGRTRVLDPSLLKLVGNIPDGLISGGMLEKRMAELLARRGVRRMEDFPMPLAIPAVDLASGRTVYFVSRKEGLLDSDEAMFKNMVQPSAAVRASVSYPVFFRPRQMGGMKLVDGGLRENIPVTVLKSMGADRVLAVRCHNPPVRAGGNAIDVASRSLEIMGSQVSQRNLRHADFVHTIVGRGIGLFDFGKMGRCMDMGYEQTVAALPEIQKKLYG